MSDLPTIPCDPRKIRPTKPWPLAFYWGLVVLGLASFLWAVTR